jgi:Pvc16 N-terminal domain
VIHEVDEALRALLRDEALPGTDVEVSFEAPTKEWAAKRNAPVVDVYLYDIREDMRRREAGRIDRVDDGRVVDRVKPLRHFKLSYLVTAWTQRPEDEHRLLTAVLRCMVRYDAMPLAVLGEELGNSARDVIMTIALPPPEDRAFADVWSALGGELKPSLDIVVTMPLDIGQVLPAGPPVLEPLLLRAQDQDGRRDEGPVQLRPAPSAQAPPSDATAATPPAGARRRRRAGS